MYVILGWEIPFKHTYNIEDKNKGRFLEECTQFSHQVSNSKVYCVRATKSNGTIKIHFFGPSTEVKLVIFKYFQQHALHINDSYYTSN